MNSVPGVITFESNEPCAFSGGGSWPAARISARSALSAAAFSARSFAALKRRERCWFIFARGAGPSIAMKSSLRGRTTANSRSMYAKMSEYISSTVSGAGRPSGWTHG